MLPVLIIINNYLHDVATAFLLAAAVIVWVLDRRARSGGPEEAYALARAFPTLNRFAWGALAWILIGGIPRTIFFTRYEWDPAMVKGLVPALVVKHALMVLAVIAGAIMWRRAARSVAEASKS